MTMDHRQSGQAYPAQPQPPQQPPAHRREAGQRAYGGHQGAAPTPYQSSAVLGYQMKRRNPLGAGLGLPLVTLGIYGMVWFVKVYTELVRFNAPRKHNIVSAIMSMFFGATTAGIWNLVVWVKLADHISDAQRRAGLEPSCSGGMGFLLGLVGFGPFYYQGELNKIIDRYGAPEDTPVPIAA